MKPGISLSLRPLTAAENRWLRRKLEDRALSAYVLDRYRIVKAVADGRSPTEISGILRCERQTVYHWVGVFNESGFRDFEKINNPHGRPAIIDDEHLRALLAIARTEPGELGLPFQRWSMAKLTEYCRLKEIIPPVSQEWIRRLLAKEGIKFDAERSPWRRSDR